MVAALFVDPKGIYPELLSSEHCWDEKRDARLYPGPHPVVAHPPCNLWGRLASSVFAHTGQERHRPAWLGGDDGGCFAAALASVRKYGGVLEHPAGSHAWEAHGLCPILPGDGLGWIKAVRTDGEVQWVCEVWQSAYGHGARKRTWLLYCGGRPPFELNWTRVPGTHVCGGDSRKRRANPNSLPRLTACQNSATPRAFALELIRLAELSRG